MRLCKSQEFCNYFSYAIQFKNYKCREHVTKPHGILYNQMSVKYLENVIPGAVIPLQGYKLRPENKYKYLCTNNVEL